MRTELNVYKMGTGLGSGAIICQFEEIDEIGFTLRISYTVDWAGPCLLFLLSFFGPN